MNCLDNCSLILVVFLCVESAFGAFSLFFKTTVSRVLVLSVKSDIITSLKSEKFLFNEVL